MNKAKKGRFTPSNPDKYKGNVKNIIYRSSWELKLMVRFDIDPNILEWGSETIVIRYYSSVDKKVRRYFPDFIVKYRNKSDEIVVDLIEVKPYHETIEPVPKKGKRKVILLKELLTYRKNTDKWKYANEYCTKHGINFKIMTEYELGIKKRI